MGESRGEGTGERMGGGDGRVEEKKKRGEGTGERMGGGDGRWVRPPSGIKKERRGGGRNGLCVRGRGAGQPARRACSPDHPR